MNDERESEGGGPGDCFMVFFFPWGGARKGMMLGLRAWGELRGCEHDVEEQGDRNGFARGSSSQAEGRGVAVVGAGGFALRWDWFGRDCVDQFCGNAGGWWPPFCVGYGGGGIFFLAMIFVCLEGLSRGARGGFELWGADGSMADMVSLGFLRRRFL